MEKEFEALDKLEECANGMKDLPKSNWIDLAENEAELDLKIMDWVETIKFELFKGKQALTELKAIKEAKPSEALKNLRICWVGNQSMGDYISNTEYEEIEQALLKAQENAKVLEIIFKHFDINVVTSNKSPFGCITIQRKGCNQMLHQAQKITFKKEEQEEFDIVKRWSEKWNLKK